MPVDAGSRELLDADQVSDEGLELLEQPLSVSKVRFVDLPGVRPLAHLLHGALEDGGRRGRRFLARGLRLRCSSRHATGDGTEPLLSLQGLVYEEAHFCRERKDAVEVRVRAREGSRPYCSGCGKRCAGYDRLPERRFEFIPLWGFAVFFLYARRRVQCRDCGIVAEILPWAEGKQTLTNAYMQYLANWARKLSWLEVARTFRTSWQKVFHSVEWLVAWGLERRVLGPIKGVGVDEIAYNRGHKYLTLVYQIEANMVRLLWVGKERTVKTFHGFFDMLGKETCAGIEFICSDMWRPYLRVIRERCGQALHVLDRSHRL